MVLIDFPGTVDSLAKVGKGIIAIKDIPANQRKEYLTIVDDTFTLLDNAILLIVSRLTNLLNHDREQRKEDFLKEQPDYRDRLGQGPCRSE